MPTPPPCLIAGGRVIDPASGFDAVADLLIVEGLIGEISLRRDSLALPPRTQRIDAEGCLVTPGLIDPHVHLRDPDPRHEETIASGSAAAVAGGFTTVCCMPNTSPPLDTSELVQHVANSARAAAGARVFTVACATQGRRGDEVADIAALAQAGAVGFSDDGDCVASARVLRAVLRSVASAGSCFMQHCQEPTLTRGAAMNEGPVAERLGLIGWPSVAEELIIERDVRLNRQIGCRYHAQHLSSGDSAAIIRAARLNDHPVTAEVSPHHLLLTDEHCAGGDTNFKMNPPLRSQRDIALLKEAVADGTISVLATDHAPHPLSRKRVAFAEAAFGIVGLECALPLYRQALIDEGVIDWPSMITMMTIHPARLVGLHREGLGTLTVGGPADVTVIDPDLEWTIDSAQFRSAGRNCPFDGWSVRGRAIATLVGGRLFVNEAPHRLERVE